MKLKEIYPNLIYIHYDTQYELASTFMRLQEFYESPYPLIKGKYFTLEQYMDEYAKRNENFTYTTDWEGFNVPGHIIHKFFDKFPFDSLLKKEQDLLQYIAYYLISREKFYLIGTYGTQKLDHEIAHGLYYLNSSYKKAMNKLIDNNHVMIIKFKQILRKMGYVKSFFNDELQAYIATNDIRDWVEFRTEYGLGNIDISLRKKFQNVFQKHKDKNENL